MDKTSSSNNPTLTDRIYQTVKEKIIRQELKPGTRLRDQEIAQELNLSRTPVREAVLQLIAEGLVVNHARRGAFVVEQSNLDIRDIYELREGLEVLAIEMAAQRVTDEQLRRVEHEHLEFGIALERGDYIACFEADRRFHAELVALSGNRKLMEFYRRLDGNIQVTRWLHCGNHSAHQVSQREHALIVDALLRRDIPATVEHVRDHIRRVRRGLIGPADDGL